MAAALTFWKSGQASIANERDDPAWTNALTFVGLAFISASLGVQGILGKRLNTQFGTTSTYLLLLKSNCYLHFASSCTDYCLGRVNDRSGPLQTWEACHFTRPQGHSGRLIVPWGFRGACNFRANRNCRYPRRRRRLPSIHHPFLDFCSREGPSHIIYFHQRLFLLSIFMASIIDNRIPLLYPLEFFCRSCYLVLYTLDHNCIFVSRSDSYFWHWRNAGPIQPVNSIPLFMC